MADPSTAVTLASHVERRNGMPMGAAGSLRQMLRRAFTAGTLAGFWRHWNPVFGYYLGRFVHVPFARVAPRPVAVVVTFLVSGAIHDLATLAVRGSTQLLFTVWFGTIGTEVVLATAMGVDLSRCGRLLRVAVNAGHVLAALGVALTITR